MDDLIRRSDAIDVVEKWFNKIELNGDICIDGLISLPSAQKWILCEERLPEKEGQYLVTLDFEWGKEIEMGDFFNGEWVNPNSHVTVAWMELPTPWKGEGE